MFPLRFGERIRQPGEYAMIVVIGASSFIGTYLVDELVAQGREVFATGHSNLNLDYYTKRNIKYAQVDLSRRQDFEKLPKENVEAVVLMASMMPNNDANLVSQPYIDVNITGTLNVLEYCRANKVKKIINGIPIKIWPDFGIADEP